MLTEAESTELVPQLFVPELATALQRVDAAGRERLLKERIQNRFAELPDLIRDSAPPRDEDVDELHVARELCEFRMPLMNGTSVAMGLPYDWYYGVNDGHLGGDAPRYIVPRIAFAGTLARACARTGEAVFAQTLHDYIMDYVSRYWVDSTALPEHDNWLCTSCRCGTWYCRRFGGIYTALSHPDLLDTFSFADLLAVFRAIDNMMTGLIPNLALGSNWRVHELSNIFTQGYCYPFLRPAATWLKLAATSLNEEFDVQFHDDGSHEELCVEYGTGTWAVFTQYFALAAQAPDTGLHFDADKMRRCLQYYLSARKPFGLLATIGDAYKSRGAAMLDPAAPPHPSGQPPAWDSVLREGAARVAAAAHVPEAEFIRHGQPEPAWHSRFHPDSGYLFLRDGWATDSLYADLNLGHYANCHCHYGLLGLEVAGYGREFVVDAGCSALDPRPINANFARTRSHSTMCVDGCDQQVAVPVQVSRLFLGEHYDFAVGVYKGGYTQGNPYGPGCTSAGRFDNCFSGTQFRHLLFIKGSYWILFDALSTRPGHTAETRFQLLPTPVKELPDGGYCTGWPASNLALLPLHWDGWEHAILQGQEDPIEGWLPAPGGGFVPAPVYKATAPTDRPPRWHGTLLFPYREAELPPITVTRMDVGTRGFGYRIETADYTDYLFVSNSWMPRDIVMDDIHTNAPLLHLRFAGSRLVRGCTCEGSYLSVAKQTIFTAPGTMLAREFIFGKSTTCQTANPRRRP